MKKINIVIPIYNEQESLPFLYDRLILVLHQIKNYSFSVLFVNDGSIDNSIQKVQEIRKKDSSFHLLNLSRNYGKEIAVLAGLDASLSYDAIILMDADLQDPPELIPSLISYWEKGYDDVFAKRKSREGESFLKKWTSKMYYRVLQKLSDVNIQEDTGDYRLLDKKCVKAICSMREVSRCSKSLFDFIGFRKKEVLFDRQKRIAGKTKWNYSKLIHLAIDGITSLSTKPLRWTIYLGMLFLFLSFILIIGGVITSMTPFGTVSNFFLFLLAGFLFIMSLQFFILGIIGEYIARIFEQTRNRPAYFMQENHLVRRKKDETKEENHCLPFFTYSMYSNRH